MHLLFTIVHCKVLQNAGPLILYLASLTPDTQLVVNLTERLFQQYIQDYRVRMAIVCSLIHDISFTECEQITGQVNETREPTIEYEHIPDFFIRNSARQKLAPRLFPDKIATHLPILIFLLLTRCEPLLGKASHLSFHRYRF